MKPKYESEKLSNNKVHYLFGSKKLVGKQNNDFSNSAQQLCSVQDYVEKLKPSIPVYFLRPNSIKRAAKFFLDNFYSPKYSSNVLYSVKSNPDVAVLNYLFASGIKDFDVASMAEVKLINDLFGSEAKIYFMHPIKSREAIYEAYFDYGIRHFSLDSFAELEKIIEVTKGAKDLSLHIRLAIPNSHAAIDLSGKFGILPSEAPSLLRKTRTIAKELGICFHVGSQCMDAVQYRNAINITKEVLDQSLVKLDVLDIGGGFPSSYPGLTPQGLNFYFDEIFDAINQLNLELTCKIWCEPGRALVAEAASLLVRVEARKEAMLYLNDGTYGGLFDAGSLGFIFPTKAIRIGEGAKLIGSKPFGFYGPTCDSLDVMKGPFYLPKNIKEGDYIEIGQVGAYSKTIRTEFNGFNETMQLEVNDEPLVSLYEASDKNNQNLKNHGN